jgi:nucleotide-binding universal stress UspA family protein
MFNKILVCVDDSAHSEQIASVGMDVAGRYGAEVVVLSVLDPARFAAPPFSGLEAIQMVDRHSRSLAHTGQRTRAAFESMGITSRLLVLPGKTAETVIEVAHQERVDLIVMGGEAKGRLRAAVEGSLWGDVARLAPCNVLRVSPKDEVIVPPRRGRGMLIPVAFHRHAVDPLAS